MTVVSSSPAMHVSALAWLHHLSYLLRGMRELLSLASLSLQTAPIQFPLPFLTGHDLQTLTLFLLVSLKFVYTFLVVFQVNFR